MEAIFDALSSYLHDAADIFEVSISNIRLIAGDNVLADSKNDILHIVLCLQSFQIEIGHSPNEVLAITGLPIVRLQSLGERLSKL